MSKLKYFDGTNWNEVGGKIAGDTLPIGSIVPFGGIIAPAGWLLCIGQTLNKNVYPELFNVIGYTFGGEDGGDTFNLPNLKGKVIVGQDTSQTEFDTIGETGGSKTDNLSNAYALVGRNTNTLSTISYKAHAGSGATFDRTLVGGGGIEGNNYTAQDTTALGGSVNNLQPYMVTNYIIKVKQTAGLVGAVIDSYSTSHTDTYCCDYINEAVLDTYSETEQIVGTWIDGNPIYRKVVDCGTMPNNTTKNVSSGITGTIFVTKLYGVMYIEDTSTVCLPDVNTSAIQYSVRLAYDIVNNNVQLITGADRSSYSGYVVVEYTKATN